MAAQLALVKYDAACRALAQAKAADEVKLIRDKADAMRAAAKIAKNRQLEVDAAEIRIRAERRLGELIAFQKETVGLNRGTAGNGRPKKGASRQEAPKDEMPTLAASGIDHKLSSRAQKLAAVPKKEFERELDDWRERVSAENSRVTTKLEKRGEDELQRRPHRAECDIPDSAIVGSRLTCPTCGQLWPEGKPIHGD